jgi:hypothetical protein
MTSKLGMPKPPKSSGRVTFSQATRQHPPLALFCPFHKKTFPDFIDSFDEPLWDIDGNQ